MTGARASPIDRQQLERIVRQVLTARRREEPHEEEEGARGERFAIEAALRAVEEAYAKPRPKAAKGQTRKRVPA